MKHHSIIKLFGFTLFEAWTEGSKRHHSDRWTRWDNGLSLFGLTYSWSCLYHCISIKSIEVKFFKNKKVWPKK